MLQASGSSAAYQATAFLESLTRSREEYQKTLPNAATAR